LLGAVAGCVIRVTPRKSERRNDETIHNTHAAEPPDGATRMTTSA
jgi:hypothetical protein